MGITRKAWIAYRDTSKIELKDPIAIVGSPGLRSVGKLAVDSLVEKLQPRLFVELFSSGFPAIYYGPSYLGAPSNAGVKVGKGNVVELPRVEIYIFEDRTKEQVRCRDLVITRGYQAYDTIDQYMVADIVTNLFTELHVKDMVSLGAQVIEKGIRCCVTDLELLEEMSQYGINRANVDRFIGFSGLVVAIGREKGIKGVCLFANTTQNVVDPEYPDFNAVKNVLAKVGEILNLSTDTSDLEESMRVEEEKRRKSEDLSGYV